MKLLNMANSFDPGVMARCYEISHLDLHCLHRHLCLSAELKGLIDNDIAIIDFMEMADLF